MFKQIPKLLLLILFSLSFFISGIIINFVQFLLYISVRVVNKTLYRKINYYLIYTIWSQVVAFSEWWSQSKVRFFFDDKTSLDLHAKTHSLYIMNHRYELDWLWAWMVLDKFEALGNAKSFAKRSLQWLPIIGWGWILGEFIFLDRDYAKDLSRMEESLKQLIAYKDPMSLLLFSEGTRFTQSKYEASVEFAKQRGLPQLKHHLVPRTKGFAFSVKYMKENYPDAVIYDVQLKFGDKCKNYPNFKSIFTGKQLIGDFYLRRVPICDVPTNTDEEISQFLYDLYQKKDKLMEFHAKNGRFPGIVVDRPRRIMPLINWVAWNGFGISVAYFVLTSGNTSAIIALIVFLGFALFGVHLINKSTKIKKDSKYGSKVDKEVKSETNSNNNQREDNSLRKRLDTKE